MRLVSIAGLPTVAAVVLVAMVMLESASPAMAARGYSHLRMSHAAPFPKPSRLLSFRTIRHGVFRGGRKEVDIMHALHFPGETIWEEIKKPCSEYSPFPGI